jgi:hypothetical protein
MRWRTFLKLHASNIWAFRNGPVVVKACDVPARSPSILSGCAASEVEPPLHLAARSYEFLLGCQEFYLFVRLYQTNKYLSDTQGWNIFAFLA